MGPNVQRKFTARSERVKCVALHPTEPLLLTSLYNGSVFIWNFAKEELYKSIEVTDCPLRCAQWIPSKNWIVVGADDCMIRIYNVHTGELVKKWEAHADYLRSIAVHPSKLQIVTSSDDFLLKLWDGERDWARVMTYEGHEHFVMSVQFNPKDPNIFVSASVDGTAKIWNVNSPTPQFTLNVHEAGANFASFYPGLDKSHLLTCGDDGLVKVWDYQTKTCVTTISGHKDNVSFALYHPTLPHIISGSEDGQIRIVSSITYATETVLDYDTGRVWCCHADPVSNRVAFGSDEGCTIVKLGHDRPLFSTDGGARVIFCKNNQLDLGTMTLPPLTSSTGATVLPGEEEEATQPAAPGQPVPVLSPARSGELIRTTNKPLASVEFFPTFIQHSPNGHFVAVCGGGSFTIYTARSGKVKSYGSGEEIVWGQTLSNSNEFAVRTDSNTDLSSDAPSTSSTSNIRGGPVRVVIYRDFQAGNALSLLSAPDHIYGGTLLGLYASEELSFYDWETGLVVERLETEEVRNVLWNKEGTLVAVIMAESFFVLRFNAEAMQRRLERILASRKSKKGKKGKDKGDDYLANIEDEDDPVFEINHEEPQKIKSALWAGDTFIFNTPDFRICTLIGRHCQTISRLDEKSYLLRYAPVENAVYVVNKQRQIHRYPLFSALLQLQTTVARIEALQEKEEEEGEEKKKKPEEEEEESEEPTIPQLIAHLRTVCFPLLGTSELRNTAARFLAAVGLPELAQEIADDADLRLQLALKAGDVYAALAIVEEQQRVLEGGKKEEAAEAASTSTSTSSSSSEPEKAPQPLVQPGTSRIRIQQQQRRWRVLGDIFLRQGQFSLAERCFAEAQDTASLFLLSSSTGDAALMEVVAKAALKQKEENTAFAALFLLRRVDECVNLLLSLNRAAEAAFFARSYAPWRVDECVAEWRKLLQIKSPFFAFTPAFANPDKEHSHEKITSSSSSAGFNDNHKEAEALGVWVKENIYPGEKPPACAYLKERWTTAGDAVSLCLNDKMLFPEYLEKKGGEESAAPATDTEKSG